MTCLVGVVILALTVTVVETKLQLSAKATMALNWQAVDMYTKAERHAAARYIQRLWRLEHAARLDPNLEGSNQWKNRMWRRRRAITRSVASVSLLEVRRKRVLSELEWTPTHKMGRPASSTGEGLVDAVLGGSGPDTAMVASAGQQSGAGGGETMSMVQMQQTLQQILTAQAELARVQEQLVQAVRHSGQATAALLTTLGGGAS